MKRSLKEHRWFFGGLDYIVKSVGCKLVVKCKSAKYVSKIFFHLMITYSPVGSFNALNLPGVCRVVGRLVRQAPVGIRRDPTNKVISGPANIAVGSHFVLLGNRKVAVKEFFFSYFPSYFSFPVS